MIDDSLPGTYLRGHPTAADTKLAEEVGLDTGAAVPFWMFARAVRQQHEVTVWAASKAALERKLKRWVIAAAGFALANLTTFAVTALHRAEDAGAAKARADDQGHEIDQIRLDMRAMWQKVTGVALPDRPDASAGGTDSDASPFPPAPKEFSLIIPPGPSCTVAPAAQPQPRPFGPLSLR